MKVKTSILVISNHLPMQERISHTLSQIDYKVYVATNGVEGMQIFKANNPDIIFLDLRQDDFDGIAWIQTVRVISQLPILVLSDHEAPHDKVLALDAGADDYLTIPFSMEELLARTRVAKRHLSSYDIKDHTLLINGNLRIDTTSQTVHLLNQEIKVTPNEYKLLVCLCQNMDRVLTYNTLTKAVWGYGYDNVETLRVFMASIRKKLEQVDKDHKYIKRILVWDIAC